MQGCSSVYKTDYFSAESEFEYEDRNPCLFSSGVGETNYGEPQKATRLNSNDLEIIICTRTRENQETITIGPLVFPIIPIFSTSNDSNPLFVVTLFLKSKDKKLIINPNELFLLTDNNKKIYMFNHTNGVAHRCNEQIGYTDTTKTFELIDRKFVDFCFNRDDINKQQYIIHFGGLSFNSKQLPPKNIIFKRFRSTFFAIAG
jgi:hypothetical protein